jgi:hypothetical protein
MKVCSWWRRADSNRSVAALSHKVFNSGVFIAERRWSVKNGGGGDIINNR